MEYIRQYLTQKYIKTSDEWLLACIDFIQSEHENIKNRDWMKEKVYEQWLYTDLITLGASCLPFDLSNHILTKISGQFALQINHIKDVGLPAYSQLKKLQNDDNKNCEVSADKQYVAGWEPKPTRMLMLELTDGTSVVQGMEYRPILSLSLGMKPGVKILLKGTIEARRGILLLTKDHVTVLGGEVDTILIPNAPENILRRTLQLEESAEPIAIPNNFTSDASSVNEQSQNYSTESTQSSIPSSRPLNEQVNRINPTLTQTNSAPFNSGRSQQYIPKAVVPVRPTVACVPEFASEDNEFLDDLDFIDPELEKALLEAERKSSIAMTQKRVQVVTPQNVSTPRMANYPTIDTGVSVSNDLPATSNNSAALSQKDSQSLSARKVYPITRKSVTSEESFVPQRSSVDDDPFDDDDDWMVTAAAEISEDFNSMPSNKSCHGNKLILSPTKSTNNNFAKIKPYNNIPVHKNNFESLYISQEKGTLSSQISSDAPLRSTSGRPLAVSSKSKPVLKQSALTRFAFEKKRQNIGPTPSQTVPSSSCDKSLKSYISDEQPYNFICFINFHPLEKVSYKILGFVATLLSKLQQNDGKWQLGAKINDGTGTCDVDIDDLVLRKLIGITVDEYEAQKEKALLNLELRNHIWQRICSGQMELIRMCCIMKIEIAPSLLRPRVVELLEVTEDHLSQLSERTNNLYSRYETSF